MSNLRDKLKPHLLPVATLLICAFGIYGTTFDHQFLVNWDDNLYVTGNESIRSFTFEHLKSAFTTFYAGNYAPTQIISYMFDYSLWGLRAGGFLFTNTLLHASSSVIFYFLLLKLHGRRLWAISAALIFLCHPLQVESVAWVSQRKNVLAMFFFLLAFLSYLHYQARGGRTGKLWYATSLAAFLLAVLTKSVAVVLPVVLLAKNICLGDHTNWRKGVSDTLPYWVISAGISMVAFISQDPAVGGGRADYWGGSLTSNCLTMLPVVARYLGMVVWPVGLSPVYAQPYKEVFDLQVALSLILLAVCFVVLIYLYRKRKLLCFWLTVFFIGLVPVSQIVPLVTLMNDRYLYFPMLGASGLFGGLIALAAEQPRGSRSKAAMLCAGLLLLPLPIMAHLKAQVWQNTETLWRNAVRNEPNASMAWLGLGHALLDRGYVNEARYSLLHSYELFPRDQDTLISLADLYQRQREPLIGRRYLLELIAVNPRHFKGLVNLGKNYLMTDDPLAAEEFYRRAHQLDPRAADVLSILGEIAAKTERLELAVDWYQKAYAAGADPSTIEYHLAGVAARAGETSKALLHLESAFQSGFHGFLALQQNQAFNTLRDEPKFQRLVQRFEGR